MVLRVAVLGSTRGSDLEGIMEAIHQRRLENVQIQVVISNKKSAYILERARNHHLEAFHIDYLQHSSREEAEEEIIKILEKYQVELVLLIGWMKILTPVLINKYRGRMWNIHPSLLPKYGGGMNLDVHKTVLENHESESGCTLHEVTEEVDGGTILCQKVVQIDPMETVESLKDKVQKAEQEAFVETLKKVVNGELKIGVQ